MAFLRRFDLEHTFRLFKQVLVWTAPKIRDPHAADRWTWLIITCPTQLFKCRTLAEQQAYTDSRLDLRAVRLLLRVAFNRRVYASRGVPPRAGIFSFRRF